MPFTEPTLSATDRGLRSAGSGTGAQPEPAWVTELSQRPLVQGLSPEDWQRLLLSAEVLDVRAGSTFLPESNESAGLFFLLWGEVAIHAAGRLVRLIAAPQDLGLLSLVDGRARSASLVAFADSRLVHLPRFAFDALCRDSAVFSGNVAQALATELRRMYAAEAGWLTHFDDFFEAPNAKLVPGPYVADRVDMVLLVMQGDAAALRRLLPPGLHPLPVLADRYLLTFNTFTGVRSEAPAARGKTFSYRETCPFLPCLGPDLRPALFIPELYPDNLLAIALGREAYGFPKRFGLTTEGDRRVDLGVGGHLVLRADWERTETVLPGEWASQLLSLWSGGVELPGLLRPLLGGLVTAAESPALRGIRPSVPVFVHKQIMDERTESERILEVDSLIEIPFQLLHLGGFQVLHGARVQHFDPTYFLQGRCLGGVRTVLGFRFGRGHARRDYRARPASGGWRDLLWPGRGRT